MKIKSFISKSLHILVIFCFFLPFFPQGCGPNKKEKDTKKTKQDSIKLIDSIANIDSVKFNTDSILKNKTSIDTTNNIPPKINKENTTLNENDGGATDKLISKWKLLKLFLRPNDNYSGIGYLIDSAKIFVVYCGIFISIILLTLGLFLKYFNQSKKYLINGIFHIIGIIFLLSTCGGMLSCEKLWGYWACIILWIILGLIDWIFIFTKNK